MKLSEHMGVFFGLLLFLTTARQISFASDEEMPASVGPGKAVIAADERLGIRLSEKAKTTIGYKLASISATTPLAVPTSSLVYYQNHVGIYVVRDDWNKLVAVQVARKTTSEVVVKSEQIKSGDQIVVSGVALLRAAELDAFAGHGDDEDEKKKKPVKEGSERDHD